MWNRISENREDWGLQEPLCSSLPHVTTFLLRFLLQKKKINLRRFFFFVFFWTWSPTPWYYLPNYFSINREKLMKLYSLRVDCWAHDGTHLTLGEGNDLATAQVKSAEKTSQGWSSECSRDWSQKHPVSMDALLWSQAKSKGCGWEVFENFTNNKMWAGTYAFFCPTGEVSSFMTHFAWVWSIILHKIIKRHVDE